MPDVAGRTKKFIPFITHGGSRASGTVGIISDLEPEAQIFKEALVISRDDVAGSKKTVTDWAESLGVEN